MIKNNKEIINKLKKCGINSKNIEIIIPPQILHSSFMSKEHFRKSTKGYVLHDLFNYLTDKNYVEFYLYSDIDKFSFVTFYHISMSKENMFKYLDKIPKLKNLI